MEEMTVGRITELNSGTPQLRELHQHIQPQKTKQKESSDKKIYMGEEVYIKNTEDIASISCCRDGYDVHMEFYNGTCHSVICNKETGGKLLQKLGSTNKSAIQVKDFYSKSKGNIVSIHPDKEGYVILLRFFHDNYQVIQCSKATGDEVIKVLKS